MNKVQHKHSYLALGDSYTIGESVEPVLRWPVQLGDKLQKAGIQMKAPRIVAKTGWTTDELMSSIDTATLHPPYDLVSLLIGVNNQYRCRDTANYRQELDILLERAIELAGNQAQRVFAVSIPDWGVMPFASENNRDPETIAMEIDAFNRIKKELCQTKGIRFINITDISRKAANNPGYIADDGLHPSSEMYEEWVNRILPVVRSILRRSLKS